MSTEGAFASNSADMSELHDAVKRLAPVAIDDHDAFLAQRASRIIIAVLRHDASVWDSDCNGFVWIRGNSRVTVKKVREAYIAQYPSILHLRIKIVSGEEPLLDDERMDELEAFKDRFIVLEAKEEDIDTETDVTPWRYPSTDVLSNSPRRPLQPVVRQAMASPKVPTNLSDGSPKKLHLRSPRHLKSESEVAHERSTTEMSPRSPRQHTISHQSQTDDQRMDAMIHVSEFDPGDILHQMLASQHPSGKHTRTPSPKKEPNAQTHPLIKREPKDSDEQERKYQDHDVPEDSQEYKPATLGGNPFQNSQDDRDEATAPVRGLALRELTNETTPERLEAGVKQGLHALSELEGPLQKLAQSTDAQSWLAQIDAVRKEAVKARTVVGVVGNTGAGKSSVINAMLDEERLVPTNCMRACTAVVTEMSYNDAKSEASRYCAKIEFIQPQDWLKELKVLFSEVFDETGRMVSEAQKPDSNAGVAYAKMRAVYPTLTKEQLACSNIEKLMQMKMVKNILGTTRIIRERSADVFYKRLQGYVDSKEKAELDKNGNKKTNPKRQFEYWPLIKVVRIFTKADALSTGAVIVDLPGVQDSNAARAAVAEGYIKQCTGLWIVAPITRAVDDKAAKSLLGNTFKRQLKYDGTYSAVTFICSKTDDISITEASDSLTELRDEMEDLRREEDTLDNEHRIVTQRWKALKGDKADHSEVIDEIDEKLDLWEELKDNAEDGKTVYAPSDRRQQKRKRASNSPQPKKRRRIRLDSDDESSKSRSDAERGGAEETNKADEEERTALSLEAVEAKLKDLKTLKKEARQARNKIEEEVKDLRSKLNDIDEQLEAIRMKQTSICVKGRNEYSRGAIKADFAAGIKELDQENAAEEDPDNFDPEDELRDYEKVAGDLPVFCVSSRAYQKLAGRLKKDNECFGFANLSDTEIPQLQTHCKKLTEKGREASCRRFLVALNQLLNSMGLWASDDGSGLNLTTHQRNAEHNFLVRKLNELQEALEKCVRAICQDVVNTLNDLIFEKLDPAIASAAAAAVPTATLWGAHKDQGGLYWATYKATVRRNGEFRKSFNGELTEPLYKHMATTWEKTFQRRLPVILTGFTSSAKKLLEQFHAAVEIRSRDKGHGITRLGMLALQLQAYNAIFAELASWAIGLINEGQRTLNREFTPVISQAMAPAYEYCTNERGTGSYKRMKDGMLAHVADRRSSMFEDAAQTVQTGLENMCKDVQKQMLDRADGVYLSMQRDYMTILGGASPSQQVTVPREERVMRRDVDKVIENCDQKFHDIINSNIEDLKVDVKDVTEVSEDVMDGLDGKSDAVESDGDDEGISGDESQDEENAENGDEGNPVKAADGDYDSGNA